MNKIELLKTYLQTGSLEYNFSKMKIYLVVNTKEETDNYDDYNSFSISTEFFSSVELNQIVASIRDTKAIVKIIKGENEFLHNVLTGKIISDKNTVVINNAQSGVGPGRKSLIPSFCKLNGFIYTGSNAYVVSLCRNKYHVNKILEAHGISTPKSWLYDYRTGWLNGDQPSENLEVLVKPIYESASIGINEESKFKYSPKQTRIIEKISRITNQPVIVQAFITGYEVETPVMKIENSIFSFFPVGISYNNIENLGSKFLTYEDIYTDNYQFYNFSNQFTETSEHLIGTAKKVYSLLGIDGFGRVDFRINEDRDFFVTDVSTNPHLTEHSSYDFLFKSLNFSREELFKALILSALK